MKNGHLVKPKSPSDFRKNYYILQMSITFQLKTTTT